MSEHGQPLPESIFTLEWLPSFWASRWAPLLAGGKDAVILDPLAGAYAEAGRFREAARTAQEAIELLQGGGPPEQARQLEARARLYQAGRPYHEGAAPQQQ